MCGAGTVLQDSHSGCPGRADNTRVGSIMDKVAVPPYIHPYSWGLTGMTGLTYPIGHGSGS